MLIGGLLAASAPTFLLPKSPTPDTTETLQGTIQYISQQAEEVVTIAAEERGALTSPQVSLEPRVANKWGPISLPTKGTIYFVVASVFLLLLLIRLLFILSLHLRARPSDDPRYKILPTGSSGGQAFTFGRTIFLSHDVVQDPDFQHILAHEQVHARQLHTIDVLLSELFLCAFWFHPAAWWLRAKVRANLEFLVDKAIVEASADRRAYQLALVRQSTVHQGLALALPFSEPSLKSRIIRMTGLPKHRLVGIIAAAAVLFWLGLAAMMVNGRVNHPPPHFIGHLEVKTEFSEGQSGQHLGTIGGVEYLRLPFQ
ncbi:MAG: M56 family metallopeptidase, partial [Bacteroidota bacterium]